MRHRCEPLVGHGAVREQIVAMRVVSRGDQHELWLDARASGTATCSTSDTQTSFPEPGGTGS